MFEQWRRVVRAGAGFRMALEAERRLISASHPLQAAIEQGLVGDAQSVRQARLVNRESMVLAGDQHCAVFNILHRMVGAVMAKLHFYRGGATGQAQQLVPKTNAEHRDIGCKNVPDCINGVGAGLRVARAVGQKIAVGVPGFYFCKIRFSRKNFQVAIALVEAAENIS